MCYRKSLSRASIPWMAALFATTFLIAGCSDQAVLNPADEASVPFNPIYAPSGASGELRGTAGVLSATSDSDWYVVASGTVRPDRDPMSISGSRYKLKFPEDAVYETTLITISEHDPNVLDMQFGPHGTQFRRSVRLTVDFSGTNADPNSPNYDGSVPAFFYFNEDTGQWEEIPGQINGLDYMVKLHHFSRYALGGRPGPGDGTADW